MLMPRQREARVVAECLPGSLWAQAVTVDQPAQHRCHLDVRQVGRMDSGHGIRQEGRERVIIRVEEQVDERRSVGDDSCQACQSAEGSAARRPEADSAGAVLS